MKNKIIMLFSIITMGLVQSSCVMIPKAKNVPPEPTHKSITINSSPSGAEVYMDGRYLGVTPLEVNVPLKYQYLASGLMIPQERYAQSAEMSATTFKFVKAGYETTEEVFKPTITQRLSGYRNYNGQVLGLDYIFPDGIYAQMQPARQPAPATSIVDTTIPTGEAGMAVSRENPGATALEKTIIRWYFDSEPRGARVFWRVVSSVPNEVKNTNELYLSTTPYEETRSFNILGLTYENSRDVQIEIKLTRPGYMDQVKRFNVRQAIDQQEISSFFDMVPAE